MKHIRLLVVASMLAAAGFSAGAQPAPPDGAPRGPMAGMGEGMQRGDGMGMRARMDPEKMQAMVAKRHAELKARLKITGDQEGAWNTFTAAMKPPAMQDHKRPDPAEMEKLTTPERIDKMRALRKEHMAAMQAAMEKREDATKALYAALNADQKKMFDAEHARRAKHHGGKHRGMEKGVPPEAK